MRMLRLVRAYPAVVATVVVLTAVLVLAATGAAAPARGTAIAWAAAVVAWILVGMVRDLVRGHVGLDVLAVMAVAATLAVDEYIAALIVVLMLTGGRALEDFAQRRARRDLSALLDRSPRVAHVLAPAGGREQEPRDAPVDEVGIGDVLLVRPGEIVPGDAVLLSRTATFDESSLTGESMPAEREMGEEVLSGAVNGTHAVRVRAVRRSADSQYQQIIALVHAAEQSRARRAARRPVRDSVHRVGPRPGRRRLGPLGRSDAIRGGLGARHPVPPAHRGARRVPGRPVPRGQGRRDHQGRRGHRTARAGALCGLRQDRHADARPPRPRRGRAAGDADELDVLMLAASAEQYSSHAFADSIRTSGRARRPHTSPWTAGTRAPWCSRMTHAPRPPR
jgi:cation transport ATPase